MEMKVLTDIRCINILQDPLKKCFIFFQKTPQSQRDLIPKCIDGYTEL